MLLSGSAHIPLPRVILIFVLTVLFCAALGYAAIDPFRGVIAERYVARGDTYLIGQQFDEAIREYDKALRWNAGEEHARVHRRIAEEAPSNMAAARDFYTKHQVKSVLALLDEAQQNFESPKAALEKGFELYSAGQYVYARYPLEKAVELDPEYPEAWHYLALTYDELARFRASYREKAVEAFRKRDSLTTMYLTEQE